MKILIVAGDGFLGRNIRGFLARNHEVYVTSRTESIDPDMFYMDLEQIGTIRKVLDEIEPEVVISCAGIVDQAQDVNLNSVFTKNLLTEVAHSKKRPTRIIISGSAAEYGYILPENLPVGEVVPLNAQQGYGLSKVREEEVAHQLASQYNLPVVVARIFNPIGVGMHPKFLISNILRQISEFNTGKRDCIELSRFDSRRDYVSVRDIASAFGAIVEGSPRYSVYNIGSGKSTTNQDLVNLILANFKYSSKPHLRETSDIVEPLVAVRADIKRLASDLNWYPQVTLEKTIKEILHAETR